MKIDAKVSADIDNSVLCWLATVDQKGAPSVSPKELWGEFGEDVLVIADLASSNSVRNIGDNPSVCVSFIDIFRQRGFKVYGQASIIPRIDQEFQVLGASLLQIAGTKFKIRNIIKVDVERIGRILAPSYKLFPDIGDTEMMAESFRTYSVRPV